MIMPDQITKEGCFIKVFGSNSNRRRQDPPETQEELTQQLPEEGKPKKKRKKNRKLRIITILLCIVLFFEAAYCFLVFTDISTIKYWREVYIDTAMSTLSHQWLATAFLPEYMVNNQALKNEYINLAGVGHNSERPKPTDPDTTVEPTEPSSTEPVDPHSDAAQDAFYETFWELNRTSFEEYLDDHPDVLRNGWDAIYINEAGLDDEGTSIYTSMGEQVLAIDAKNKILLIRVAGSKEGNGYQGVLAVAKDPALLRCGPSAGIGSYGQTLGELVKRNDGVLGIVGSGFIDPNGNGTGGIVAGYVMCSGTSYGTHDLRAGTKRLELTQDNKLYVIDSFEPVASDVTDAVEFSPALIVDGELMVSGFSGWGGVHPRAAIGQSERGEILMLIIEGRMVGRSIGTDIEECAEILKRHKCYTAMNLDGGTSAVMWYDGEYVTKCSNTSIESRLLPNAWVYGYSE